MASLFRKVRPDTVIHTASMIDCRPHPSPLLDAVNVDGTATLIQLCQEHGARRLVYTSSIEVMYGAAGADNACEDACESLPYPAKSTQGYQRTKIAAEKLVLAAHSPGGLQSCVLRPGHIYGPGDDLFFLAKVGSCFGRAGFGSQGVRMSMVHVENMAHAHLLAARRLLASGAKAAAVGGKAINIGDFDENIVATYHEMAGAPPPSITLPFALLKLIVSLGVLMSHLAWYLFGVRLGHPKTTVASEAALSAGLPATMSSVQQRELLGYTPPLSRERARAQCAAWFEATGGGRHVFAQKQRPLIEG